MYPPLSRAWDGKAQLTAAVHRDASSATAAGIGCASVLPGPPRPRGSGLCRAARRACPVLLAGLRGPSRCRSPVWSRSCVTQDRVPGEAAPDGDGGAAASSASATLSSGSDLLSSGYATRLLGHALTCRSVTCHRVPLKCAARSSVTNEELLRRAITQPGSTCRSLPRPRLRPTVVAPRLQPDWRSRRTGRRRWD
jgi:hypothetical protein